MLGLWGCRFVGSLELQGHWVHWDCWDYGVMGLWGHWGAGVAGSLGSDRKIVVEPGSPTPKNKIGWQKLLDIFSPICKSWLFNLSHILKITELTVKYDEICQKVCHKPKKIVSFSMLKITYIRGNILNINSQNVP